MTTRQGTQYVMNICGQCGKEKLMQKGAELCDDCLNERTLENLHRPGPTGPPGGGWKWPDVADIVAYEDLAVLAADAKEQAIEHLKGLMVLGAYAEMHGACREIGGVYGCSTHRMRLYARMFYGLAYPVMFEDKKYIEWHNVHPDLAVGAYSACADVAGQATSHAGFYRLFQKALALALEGMSPREIRDKFNVERGRQQAKPWLNCRARVWNAALKMVEFDLEEEIPKDQEPPKWVDLRATPVEGSDGD